MIVERVPTSLRNTLSRWLIEPSTGVFVGSPSARIRDELWKKVLDASPDGTALQVWSAQNPQGFAYRQHNAMQRELVLIDGLTLVRTLRKEGTSDKRKV
jgi:CRISPR-associated protein Cas2